MGEPDGNALNATSGRRCVVTVSPVVADLLIEAAQVQVCECGHYRYLHGDDDMRGRCDVRRGKFNACQCKGFTEDPHAV